jgi:hypothetical protein
VKKQYWLMSAIVVLLIISGIGLYLCLPPSEDEFPHPFNGTFRQFHGAAAYLALIGLGYMLGDHIAKKWRYWRRHLDGVMHLILWLLLSITGLLLYYPIMVLDAIAMGTVHWYLGVTLLLVYPAHASQLQLKRWWRKSRTGRASSAP